MLFWTFEAAVFSQENSKSWIYQIPQHFPDWETHYWHHYYTMGKLETCTGQWWKLGLAGNLAVLQPITMGTKSTSTVWYKFTMTTDWSINWCIKCFCILISRTWQIFFRWSFLTLEINASQTVPIKAMIEFGPLIAYLGKSRMAGDSIHDPRHKFSYCTQ